MKLDNKLELIYIPASYWNEPLSGFELVSKGKQLPRNSSFFFIVESSKTLRKGAY